MLLEEGCGPLDPLADLTDDLLASGRLFAPDRERRFQRRCFEESELHRFLVGELERRFGGTRPHVILCCGKCRVGSTPLANVFGHAGLPAFYQPMKTLLRYQLVDEACPPWSLMTDQPVVFLKETLGPYVTAECAFSPLQVLLDIGFRRQDITLLIMERDPLATIDSWWRCWHDRVTPEELLRTFFLASFNVHQIAAMAADYDVQVEYYLHEESREPESAVSRLFDVLGLDNVFDISILHNWTASDSLRGSNAAVRFFSQPQAYRIEDIHLELEEYRFVPRDKHVSKIPFQEGDMVLLGKLRQFYQRVREDADGVKSI